MLLGELVTVSAQVQATRSKLEKTRVLAALLSRISNDEIAFAVSCLAGAVPQSRLGIGQAALQKASAVSPNSESSLSLKEFSERLDRCAAAEGKGSTTFRQQILAELFSKSTVTEQEFLYRLLAGGLRQGALEGLMADAIAAAAKVPATSVRRAVMLSASMGEVAVAAMTQGEPGLAKFKLELMRPLQPMLAGTATSMGEALGEIGEAALEYKLDGARVQVHKDGDVIRVFSREGNDVTASAVELVTAVGTLPARSFVLDGETIALKADGTPHAFQNTMRRFGRKLATETLRQELPLSTYFFDVLHLDGNDILGLPFTERQRALAQAVPESLRVAHTITSDAAHAEAFYEQALQAGHEGLVAKSLSAPYEAGRRGSGWLKIKPTQTLDLVVLAVEWGSGRREGWLSNIHLGAREPKDNSFVMLGKTFKGMTDEMLEWQTKWFLAHELSREGHVVHVKPELVAEVAFDSVQASPHYPGGVALRFARVKRYREDKSAAQADTLETVLKFLKS